MIKFLAIVQARLSSQRLPRKVLEYFSGNTLIGHIIDRLTFVKGLDGLIVAIGDHWDNKDLIEYCLTKKIKFYIGSEEDVLSRFYHASLLYKSEYIVRITADDPLKDPEIIDKAILYTLSNNGIDYVSNTLIATYPEGLDIEIFKTSALAKAYNHAVLEIERQHVTPFIWKNPQIFSLYNFQNETDLSNLRWTVDYQDDLEFIKKIYKFFEHKKIFFMSDILEFLEKYPHLNRTCENIIRNEGYLESLKNEHR